MEALDEALGDGGIFVHSDDSADEDIDDERRRRSTQEGKRNSFLMELETDGFLKGHCHHCLRPVVTTHTTSIMYVRALRDAVARTLSNSDNETQSGGQGGGAHWEVCGGSGEFKKGRVGRRR